MLTFQPEHAHMGHDHCEYMTTLWTSHHTGILRKLRSFAGLYGIYSCQILEWPILWSKHSGCHDAYINVENMSMTCPWGRGYFNPIGVQSKTGLERSFSGVRTSDSLKGIVLQIIKVKHSWTSKHIVWETSLEGTDILDSCKRITGRRQSKLHKQSRRIPGGMLAITRKGTYMPPMEPLHGFWHMTLPSTIHWLTICTLNVCRCEAWCWYWAHMHALISLFKWDRSTFV